MIDKYLVQIVILASIVLLSWWFSPLLYGKYTTIHPQMVTSLTEQSKSIMTSQSLKPTTPSQVEKTKSATPSEKKVILQNVVEEGKSTYFQEAGTFGDSFGAINSLFTGLAFVFVFVTFNMQRQEIKRQRSEFNSQKFRDIFFNLLDYKKKVYENTKLIINEIEYSGGEKSFEAFSKMVALNFVNLSGQENGLSEKEVIQFMCERIQAQLFYHRLLPYINIIKLILKTLSETHLPIDDVKIYKDLLFYDLSRFEQLFLAYTIISNIFPDLNERAREFKLLSDLIDFSYIKESQNFSHTNLTDKTINYDNTLILEKLIKEYKV